jgi:hypothetical protein
MGFSLTFWTPEEDALLRERMASGETIASTARSFPNRTERSVLSRAAKLRGTDNRDFDRRKARNSSERLVSALKRLMGQMSPEELADVLGGHRAAIPGTERIYRGCAAERLAA